MAKPLSILLVEDNLAIAKQITEFLESHRWDVDFAATGKLGLKLALERSFDVVILDLNLPDIDGLEVCDAIKASAATNVPVLMLTARDAFEDKARGFHKGADDYLTKPFDLRELALRCEAMARRPALHAEAVIERGGLVLNIRSRQVSWAGSELAVTRTGFSILQKLTEEYPYPVSRSDLLQHIWGDEPPQSNALKSHIYSLRKALEQAAQRPLLTTISNIGYQLQNLDD